MRGDSGVAGEGRVVIRAVAATTAGTAMAVPVFVGTKIKIYLACRRSRKL